VAFESTIRIRPLLTEQIALAVEFGGAAAKETASQARIAKVEFGTFDESFDAIAEPGWQEFDQKQSLD